MQMGTLAKGLALWADHQALSLPFLRKATARDASNAGSVTQDTTVTDRVILFIEPRAHPSTEFVLRNLRYFCTWPILIVHGTTNEQFMRTIVNDIRGEFRFLSTRVADLPNPAYNTLFTCPAFWESIPERWILITQTDTMLMRHADKELQALIDAQVPYIGAPWKYTCHLCDAPLDLGCGHMIDQKVVASLAPNMVGNGGFCFRDRLAVLDVLSRFKLDSKPVEQVLKAWSASPSDKVTQRDCTNEDVFYAKSLTLLGRSLPGRADALRFAVEQLPPVEWPSEPNKAVALGCHKPWVYLAPNLIKGILNRVEYR